MRDFLSVMKAARIIPVVKIRRATCAPHLAKALLAGGISVVEITFRSDAARDAIRFIRQEVPEMQVCAGTVLTLETASAALDAGAMAIISPGTNPEVIQYCLERQVPVFPGVATPTEVETCMRMGLSTLKLFPAEVIGGVKLLKALSGPYSSVQFMPTGGINLANLPEYLSQTNVLACGGTWIAPESLIDSEDYSRITALAREAVAAAGL